MRFGRDLKRQSMMMMIPHPHDSSFLIPDQIFVQDRDLLKKNNRLDYYFP